MNITTQIFFVLVSLSSFVTSCDSTSKTDTKGNSTDAKTKETINKAMRESGVLLPSGIETIDAQQVIADEASARSLTGGREIFSDMHNQGVTLLPKNSAPLRLTKEASPEETTKPVPQDNNQCPEPKVVCAKACATATAQAYAAAYAHASATACAWAEAWACVFTVKPFTQVCSWAKSQACSTAFSLAFAASLSVDTQTVCAEQCK